MIGIVNYGQGNLGSIENMLRRLGENSKILDDPKDLDEVSKIILPGVGTFDTGMKKLQEGGWKDMLDKKVLVDKVVTLGICLGMQLLTNSSEEGVLPGLGYVNGRVKKFNFERNSNLKIPHMGWNVVSVQREVKIVSSLFTENRYYFAHSYYVQLDNENDEILSATYGHQFTAGFEFKNVIGLQFHPEKSHKFGMAILKNFISKY